MNDQMTIEKRAVAMMLNELAKADAQHAEANDIYEMLAVLGEEFGELQQAALDFDYRDGSYGHLVDECIQVGAMAIKTYRFLMLALPATRRRGSIG